MQDLIARLEAAEAGSRELDREVGELTNAPMSNSGDVVGLGYANYTTSVGDALVLAELALPNAYPGISRNVFHGLWSAWLHENVDGSCNMISNASNYTSPAMAICVAVIRAKLEDEN